MTARDQSNGEVLLEWQPQPNAVRYLVQRAAPGVPAVSIDAGDHTNAMDFSGIAPSYIYTLLAIDAAGTQIQVGGSLSYMAPTPLRASIAQVAGLRPRLRSAIGTNLDDLQYYGAEVPFVDVMKSSSSWISGDAVTWDNGQPLDLDANGWVRSLASGQIARKLMLNAIADHYPAGQYLVRYMGQGTLKFVSASVVPGPQQAGQMLIQITPDLTGSGIQLQILATNPADYVREIEIIMPGGICEGDPFTVAASASNCVGTRFLSFADYPRSIVFNPVFADRLRAYSVLRFMDWMKTNGSTVANWSQVTPMSFHTWTLGGGAPIEAMIRLANRVGAHPWFNMPHQSDNAYAQNFAQMLQAQLNPALGVYVEDSNEVWNSRFAQNAYETNQGAAQVPPLGIRQYHALRTRMLGGIFKNVLGAARVVATLGAQAADQATASDGLNYLQSRFGAVALGIDAVAIAPYYGPAPTPANAATYTVMTLTDLFNYVATSPTEGLPRAAALMATYRTLANTYGVRLISYEGGQGLVGVSGAENNVALSTLFDAFNRDPRVGPLYSAYLGNWKAAGGELFVHFNDISRYTKWGRWGALEYVDQPRAAAPKFDAIQTFIETNPVWWTQ